MEAAENQARLIESNSQSESVCALDDKQQVSDKNKRGNCFRRRLEGHFAREPECKARSATCQKCNKFGHITKFCRTKTADINKRENVHYVTKDGNIVFIIQSGARDTLKMDIELGASQLCDVLIDSGSTCNVGDRETWGKLKKKKI